MTKGKLKVKLKVYPEFMSPPFTVKPNIESSRDSACASIRVTTTVLYTRPMHNVGFAGPLYADSVTRGNSKGKGIGFICKEK